MEWGDKIEWLYDLEEEDGKTPAALLRQPELSPDLEAVLTAFSRLSRDRAVGFAMGPLPWSSIDRYAARHEIDGDELDRLSFLLMRMDGAYLKFVAERSKSSAKGKS